MDAILVLVPCPTLQRDKNASFQSRKEAIQQYKNQFDDAYIDSVRDAVWQRLAAVDSLQNLSQHLVHEVVDTPGTYADQYHVGAGTPFALSHGFAQLSITRPGFFSAGLDNVCFCGASSRPGNGVPLVLTGAKLAAQKVVSALTRVVA